MSGSNFPLQLPLLLVVLKLATSESTFDCHAPGASYVSNFTDFYNQQTEPTVVIPYESHPELSLGELDLVGRLLTSIQTQTCNQFIYRRPTDSNFVLVDLDHQACGLTQLCTSDGRPSVKLRIDCPDRKLVVGWDQVNSISELSKNCFSQNEVDMISPIDGSVSNHINDESTPLKNAHSECDDQHWKPIEKLSSSDRLHLIHSGMIKGNGRPLFVCRGYAWRQVVAGLFDEADDTCEISLGKEVLTLRRKMSDWLREWSFGRGKSYPRIFGANIDNTGWAGRHATEMSNMVMIGGENIRYDDYDVAICEPLPKTTTYNFTVSYIQGHPDGVMLDRIIGINGQFPGPLIEAHAGDTVQIIVTNHLPDQNITLHWHGIHQNGTPFEDGPSQITQCPIRPASYQIYKFPVPVAGTYWYHSHVSSQYTAGLWGGLIVRPRKPLYHYDQEILITLSDWYHTSTFENDAWVFDNASQGAPPYPFSVLMNGLGRYPCEFAALSYRYCSGYYQMRPVFHVAPGKTYRLRLINASGYTAFNFSIDGHSLETIEVDGVDTIRSGETKGSAVFIASGQRYSFLVRTVTRVAEGSRFLIRASARTELLFNPVASQNVNPFKEAALFGEVTGVLQYVSRERNNGAFGHQDHMLQHVKEPFDFTRHNPEISWDDLHFIREAAMMPLDGVTSPTYYDVSVELQIRFVEDENGVRRATFNGSPFVGLDNRPLLNKFIRGDPIPPGLNPVWIDIGEVVQVVINNPAEGPHPIHLHGHHFWVLGAGEKGDGNYDPDKHQLNPHGPRRDTTVVKEQSWLVIRFVADNVGVWTLHCHIDWHMLSGMMIVFIEGSAQRSQLLPVPAEAKAVCAAHGIEF